METEELNKTLEILISYKNKFLFSSPGKYDPDLADMDDEELKEEYEEAQEMILVKTEEIITQFVEQVDTIERVYRKYFFTIITSVNCFPERLKS